MASIFPGMDPFLEGPATWPGLHHRLISEISKALQPRLLPHYYSEIGERLYIEDVRHSIYPDVSVFRNPGARNERGGTVAAIADAPTLVAWDYQHREPFLEIRRIGSNEVIAILEVLSPTNKAPGANGREEYLRKQQEVLQSSVHLIEIDLLREGAPTVYAAPGKLLANGHYDYIICVCRGDRRGESEVYLSCVQHRLPRPKIPLRSPDPDVVLDLPEVFTACYDEGGYAFRLDYSQSPPAPRLIPEDEAWLDAHLRSLGLRA